MKYTVIYINNRKPDEFEGTLISFNEQTGTAKFDIPGSDKVLTLEGVDEVKESEAV